jgi:hypothetical protein
MEEPMREAMRTLLFIAFLCKAAFLFAQEENVIHDSFIVGENIAVSIDIALTKTSLSVELTLENKGAANAMLSSNLPDMGNFFGLRHEGGEVQSGHYKKDGTLKPYMHGELDWRFKPEMAKVIEPGQKITFSKQCKIIRTENTFVVLGENVDNVFYHPKKMHIDVVLYQFEGDIADMKKLDFTEGAVLVPDFEKTYLLAEFEW